MHSLHSMLHPPRAAGRLLGPALAMAGAVMVLALRFTNAPWPLVYSDEFAAVFAGRREFRLWGAGQLALPELRNPMHILLIGAVDRLGAPLAWLNLYSAAAGLLSILLLVWVAWRHWGATGAAVTGAFAGAMPLSIYYSHSLLAEADGGLAVALVLACAGHRRRFLAACLLGLGFNYRYLPTIGPFLLMGGVPALGLAALYLAALNHRWRTAGATAVGTAIAWLAASRWAIPAWVLSPRWRFPVLAVTSLAGSAAILLLFPVVALVPGLVRTSPELQHAFGTGPAPALLAHLDFYPRIAWWLVGPAFLVVLGIALPAAWRRRQEPALGLALALLGGGLVTLTIGYDKAPRSLFVLVGPAALLAGGAPAAARRLGTQAGTVLGAIAVPAMIANCALVLPGLSAPDDGAAAVAGWLVAHPGAYASQNTYVDVYQPSRPRATDAGRSVAALRAEGIRYVLDSGPQRVFGTEMPAAAELGACAVPVATFADPALYTDLFMLETADVYHGGYDDALRMRARALAAAGGRPLLLIYDLEAAPDC